MFRYWPDDRIVCRLAVCDCSPLLPYTDHQCSLTVKHILMECVDCDDVRNSASDSFTTMALYKFTYLFTYKHFVAFSIKDVFHNVEHRTSLILLKKLVFISNFNFFHINVCYLLFILA